MFDQPQTGKGFGVTEKVWRRCGDYWLCLSTGEVRHIYTIPVRELFGTWTFTVGKKPKKRA